MNDMRAEGLSGLSERVIIRMSINIHERERERERERKRERERCQLHSPEEQGRDPVGGLLRLKGLLGLLGLSELPGLLAAPKDVPSLFFSSKGLAGLLRLFGLLGLFLDNDSLDLACISNITSPNEGSENDLCIIISSLLSDPSLLYCG